MYNSDDMIPIESDFVTTLPMCLSKEQSLSLRMR